MLIVKGKCFHFRKKVLLKLDSEKHCIGREKEGRGVGRGRTADRTLSSTDTLP